MLMIAEEVQKKVKGWKQKRCKHQFEITGVGERVDFKTDLTSGTLLNLECKCGKQMRSILEEVENPIKTKVASKCKSQLQEVAKEYFNYLNTKEGIQEINQIMQTKKIII